MLVAVILLTIAVIGLSILWLLTSLRLRRFRPIVDLEQAIQQMTQARAQEAQIGALQRQQIEQELQQITTAANQRRAAIEAEKQQLDARAGEMRREMMSLDDQAAVHEFGLYEPRYDFENARQYKDRLKAIRDRQKQMVRDKLAVVCTTDWVVEGSRAKGRTSTNNTFRLMLRAFNGDCDSIIARVKFSNVQMIESRIAKSRDIIDSICKIQDCRITDQYLSLKREELHLVHEYAEKRQDEKEEQAAIREQMREEARAIKEIEKATRDAEAEERRYLKALEKARADVELVTGKKQAKLLAKIELLQSQLEGAQANKQRALSRAQMTKSGHVYVISNLGSFGEDVYKIGMTRRLEPLDRVKELGDASVPFTFDVHALIWTEDAPALENTLHHIFHRRRMNKANNRKEFFRVTLDEIAAEVKRHHAEIQFTLVAEAKDYRETCEIEQRDEQTAIPALVLRRSRSDGAKAPTASSGASPTG